MTMKLESLTIALRNQYAVAGPDNRYQAKLQVSHQDNRMTVALDDDVCKKILALAGDEIAKAAQVQISDFVATALAVSHAPAIEGTAQ